MLISEFTQRTGVEVSYNEYEAINKVYMHSNLDKDAFCKEWCKMNAPRVEKAKADAKRRAELAKITDYLWNLMVGRKFGPLKYAQWWFDTSISTILCKRDFTYLEKAGIATTCGGRERMVNEVYGDLRSFFKSL